MSEGGGAWSGRRSCLIGEVEVAVRCREAACLVDVTEEVLDHCGFCEEGLNRVRCRAELETHAGAGCAIGYAVEDEVGDRFAGVAAFGAGRGVDLGDTVQVMVQRGVSGAKLDKEAGVSARQGGDETEEGLGGKGRVDAAEEGGTQGEGPFGFGSCEERRFEGLSYLGKAGWEGAAREPMR